MPNLQSDQAKLCLYINTATFLTLNPLIHKTQHQSFPTIILHTPIKPTQQVARAPKHSQSANQVPHSCTRCMCMESVLPWWPRRVYLQVNAGLVPSDIRRLQLLDEDDDDPDEEHKINLMKESALRCQSNACTPSRYVLHHPSQQRCWILVTRQISGLYECAFFNVIVSIVTANTRCVVDTIHNT